MHPLNPVNGWKLQLLVTECISRSCSFTLSTRTQAPWSTLNCLWCRSLVRFSLENDSELIHPPPPTPPPPPCLCSIVIFHYDTTATHTNCWHFGLLVTSDYGSLTQMLLCWVYDTHTQVQKKRGWNIILYVQCGKGIKFKSYWLSPQNIMRQNDGGHPWRVCVCVRRM